MAYLPLTDAEREQMVQRIGVSRIEDLFDTIPESLLQPALDLPAPLSEQELAEEVGRLAAVDRPLSAYASFLGGGVYWRHIPALVRATISRPEFYTAYTPYQAEASQGTLQSIFEFQSMICALTGLDVANASLYDGPTAAAEAAILACFHTGRHHVAVADNLSPDVIAVMRTFLEARRAEVRLIPSRDGIIDARAITAAGDDCAAVVLGQPSYWGTLQPHSANVEATHRFGALAIAYVDPMVCSVVSPPGETGFDVAVGDAQQFGIPLSYGGPHLGFMAVTQALLRRLPGRLVGQTVDADGERAFCLTLQTREQHIRREKATSNICTNHALMALAASVYMAQMGAGGLRALVDISSRRAHALAARLTALPGFELRFPQAPFLFEFCLRVPGGNARAVAARLRAESVLGGIPLASPLEDCLLVACTERTPSADMDRYVTAATAIGERA